jgi:hypothetical protein
MVIEECPLVYEPITLRDLKRKAVDISVHVLVKLGFDAISTETMYPDMEEMIAQIYFHGTPRTLCSVAPGHSTTVSVAVIYTSTGLIEAAEVIHPATRTVNVINTPCFLTINSYIARVTATIRWRLGS